MKDLTLADPQFYLPGRIDVLIGADVLPYVMNTDGHPSSITTTDTVFGHAIMGTYTPSISTTTDKASIQLAVQSTPEDDLKILRRDLARFWEMDNLLIPIGPYNKAELRALTEYKQIHISSTSLRTDTKSAYAQKAGKEDCWGRAKHKPCRGIFKI